MVKETKVVMGMIDMIDKQFGKGSIMVLGGSPEAKPAMISTGLVERRGGVLSHGDTPIGRNEAHARSALAVRGPLWESLRAAVLAVHPASDVGGAS